MPRVDLRDWRSGTPGRKASFVAALSSAFRDTGFVTVEGHSLNADLTDALYHQARLFFERPTGEKKRFEVPGGAGQRGYTPFGKEHARNQSRPDLKEFFQFGQEVFDGALPYPPNVWVEDMPDFNATMRKAFRLLEADGTDLMRAVALALRLEEGYFDRYLRGGNSILRPLHYPPIDPSAEGAVRSAAHEDINLITLLMGSSAEGLEVLRADGTWQAVEAGHRHLVVNVGDMLQRATNNTFKSTTHRVVNPTGDAARNSRYSIPFFLHPIPSMPLKALPGCTSPTNPARYAPITAGEYLDERLAEIGLLK